MKKISIIGDVAGNIKTLKALWDRLDPESFKVFVGDLFDRGPSSKEVFEFVYEKVSTGEAESLYGNHEDFLVRSLASESMEESMHWRKIWTMPRNGGGATLRSFYDPESDGVMIPLDLVEWLRERPLYYEAEGLFVSHAPQRNLEDIKNANAKMGFDDLENLIWQRSAPPYQPGVYQVFGHNGDHRTYLNADDLSYARCIDNSRNNELLALEFPTGNFITQPYIDGIHDAD